MTSAPNAPPEPLRLHIGGVERKEGWKILNAQAGPAVDFVGTSDDLSQFADGSVDEVYASHIFEHLSYFVELPRTLFEVSRVVRVGGRLRIAVPDLDVLCRLMVADELPQAQRFHVMRMIYGGQVDEWDFHKVGYTFGLLAPMLDVYCFRQVERVRSFGLFKDCSELCLGPYSISLNVQAVRVAGTPPALCPWRPVDPD